eukprot:365252-Chlamydomonas_euryale.AAC.38
MPYSHAHATHPHEPGACVWAHMTSHISSCAIASHLLVRKRRYRGVLQVKVLRRAGATDACSSCRGTVQPISPLFRKQEQRRRGALPGTSRDAKYTQNMWRTFSKAGRLLKSGRGSAAPCGAPPMLIPNDPPPPPWPLPWPYGV